MQGARPGRPVCGLRGATMMPRQPRTISAIGYASPLWKTQLLRFVTSLALM